MYIHLPLIPGHGDNTIAKAITTHAAKPLCYVSDSTINLADKWSRDGELIDWDDSKPHRDYVGEGPLPDHIIRAVARMSLNPGHWEQNDCNKPVPLLWNAENIVNGMVLSQNMGEMARFDEITRPMGVVNSFYGSPRYRSIWSDTPGSFHQYLKDQIGTLCNKVRFLVPYLDADPRYAAVPGTVDWQIDEMREMCCRYYTGVPVIVKLGLGRGDGPLVSKTEFTRWCKLLPKGWKVWLFAGGGFGYEKMLPYLDACKTAGV